MKTEKSHIVSGTVDTEKFDTAARDKKGFVHANGLLWYNTATQLTLLLFDIVVVWAVAIEERRR